MFIKYSSYIYINVYIYDISILMLLQMSWFNNFIHAYGLLIIINEAREKGKKINK